MVKMGRDGVNIDTTSGLLWILNWNHTKHLNTLNRCAVWMCECVWKFLSQSLSIVAIFDFKLYFINSSLTKRSTPFAWSFNSTTAMKKKQQQYILNYSVVIKECDICETTMQLIWRWKRLINFFLCIFFFTLICRLYFPLNG